ncbi:hypothetical protein NVS47_04205 [Dehalobacterium formicoaceticum]|uniref:Uncharacterized protein n=1 Tax=Dehalobacterium formicoaceticum TaxID=51515 RepID=A0ABT1Y1L1_9FIRM|nr:hypothetical protein [Dehalobacterium formicoaceticum]MCR6544725.1 hypothetical protein [Dehalobacterium formicoaceticum]
MDDKILGFLEKMYIEIENIKSIMATKEDLSNMATKEDLSNMATKEDLSNMATKEDLSNMATKEDLFKIEQKLVLMEDKMEQNHKALYDGYRLTYEKLEILNKKVNEIERNVEKHDIAIRAIRREVSN